MKQGIARAPRFSRTAHEMGGSSLQIDGTLSVWQNKDTYGHMAGNDYIKSCAKLHLEILPGDSTVFRTGGDEFVSFLPGQGEAQMEDLLKKMREGAKKYCVKGETLSVSFGYYTMHAGEKLTECIEKADNRMYLDKAKNKNGKGR